MSLIELFGLSAKSELFDADNSAPLPHPALFDAAWAFPEVDAFLDGATLQELAFMGGRFPANCAAMPAEEAVAPAPTAQADAAPASSGDVVVPRPCHRGGRNKGVELSLPQVRAVQHLSLREAAAACDVGTTQFKLQCRKMGIARWPHRKLKSLSKLIKACAQKASALPQHEGAGASLRGWTAQLEASQCLSTPTVKPQLPAYVETIRQWNVRHSYNARKQGGGRAAALQPPPAFLI